jgi:hypothetical protein
MKLDLGEPIPDTFLDDMDDLWVDLAGISDVLKHRIFDIFQISWDSEIAEESIYKELRRPRGTRRTRTAD